MLHRYICPSSPLVLCSSVNLGNMYYVAHIKFPVFIATAEELGNVIKFLEVVTGSAADDAAIFLEKVKHMLAGY